MAAALDAQRQAGTGGMNGGAQRTKRLTPNTLLRYQSVRAQCIESRNWIIGISLTPAT